MTTTAVEQTQRKWFGFTIPLRRKKNRKTPADPSSCQNGGGTQEKVAIVPLKAHSFDSMDVISAASLEEFQSDYLILSHQKTGTVTASVSSGLHKMLLTTQSTLVSNNDADDITHVSSLVTTCSSLTHHLEHSIKQQDENCFDTMSTISDELDEPIIAEQEKHIVEWEFSSNISGWYSGPLLENEVPHGRGSCVLENGDKYEGLFHHGKMHGPSATLVKPDGSIYIGDVFNNLPHGFGTRRTSNRRYVGKFECGVPHGEGTQYYLDGSIDFEGLWVSGEATVDVKQLDLEILAALIAPISLEDFLGDIEQGQHASGENGKRHCLSSF